MDRKKFLWFTDTHLNLAALGAKFDFYLKIEKEKPDGVFLTGDISNGSNTINDLKYLARNVEVPIYFVLGNHDYFYNSIDGMNDKIRLLCKEYPNLIWMTESNPIALNNEVSIIGTEGWYDAMVGDPKYIKYTFDWFMISNIRKLPSMKDRIEAFRKLADVSCNIIEKQLNKALDDGYKTIYMLTHFPPWVEATRDVGTIMEKFWLPYNTNLRLGKLIESIMKDRNKINLFILCGHSHCPLSIRVTRNINCQVGKAHTHFKLNSQIIYA